MVMRTNIYLQWIAIRRGGHAVSICAASSKPSSLIACSRRLNFWIFPVTVVGKLSTNFQ